MAVQYDLSAAGILKMLGCTEPVGREGWEEQRKEYHDSWPMDKTRMEIFDEEYHQKIPTILYDFLCLANDHPLFETADVWAAGQCCFPYFSYEEIEERIEEDQEHWEEAPEEYEDDEYYQLSQIPREQWKEHVPNYLQIGSDYAAGVVNFGICETDLEKEDPPVYYWNEDSSIKDWRVITNTLSDFLGGIVCDILSGAEYSTAQEFLEEEEGGWEFRESKYNSEEEIKKQLAQKQIDLSAMRKYPSFYGADDFYRICADEDAGTLYLVQNDKTLLVIQKAV